MTGLKLYPTILDIRVSECGRIGVLGLGTVATEGEDGGTGMVLDTGGALGTDGTGQVEGGVHGVVTGTAGAVGVDGTDGGKDMEARAANKGGNGRKMAKGTDIIKDYVLVNRVLCNFIIM